MGSCRISGWRLFPGFSIFFLVPVLGEQTVFNQNGSINLNAEV